MDVLNVAKAITYLRKRAGFTQKDLADRLGVSDKAVSKWERGLGLPDVSLLGKLSIILDTDTDSLLAGDVIHHDRGWHGLLILHDNVCGIGPDTIVYDKPLVYYLLSYFLLVGIRNVKIICSDDAKRYIRNEFLVKKPLNVTLTFGSGISDAVNDETFVACDNLMVLFGRSFIYGVDMTKFFQKAMSNKDKITVLTLPRGVKDASSIVRFDANKKIVPPDHDDQLKTQYDYCDIPLFFCPKTTFCETFCASSVDYNISLIFEDQDVYIEVLDRGFVEIELNDWDDVAEAAAFVKIVQSRCGMILYCIEEVAWRRGYISYEAMKMMADVNSNTAYSDYLRKLGDGFAPEKGR